MNRNLLAIFLIFGLVLLLVGCSKGFTPRSGANPSVTQSSFESGHRPVNGMVQSNDGGGVTIDVEWMGIRDGSLVLDVAMNTHSVDLDQYDISKLATLMDSNGNEYRASSWDSAPGGHHRSGVLYFPVPESLSQDSSDYMKMIIRDVAGIDEWAFTWDMK